MKREEKILALKAKDKLSAGESLSRQEKIALLKARDAGLLGGGGMGGSQGGQDPEMANMESEQTFPEYAAETAVDFGVGAQKGATMGFAGRAIPAIKDAEILAAQRSPFATTAGDIAGTVATGLGGAKLLGKAAPKAASAIEALYTPKNIPEALASGVVQGVGRSDKGLEDPKGLAVDVGINTAATAGPAMLFKGAKAAMTDPLEQRAAAVGAKSRDFAVSGPKDVREVTKSLKTLGFYDQAKKKWDNSKKKFVMAFGDEAKKIPEKLDDRYVYRANQAIEELSKENDKLLAGKSLNYDDVIFKARESINDILQSDLPEDSAQAATDYIENWVKQNLGDPSQIEYFSGRKIPAENLEALKRNIQKTLAKQYDRPGDALSTDIVNAKTALASNLRKALEEVGGETYAKNNEIQSALFVTLEDLKAKMNKEAGRAAAIPGNPFQRTGEILTEGMGLNPMTRATMKEAGAAIQSQVPATEIIQAAPMSVMDMLRDKRQQMQSRSPDAVQEQARNYNFQRVKSLMTQPLPRSSDELINNAAARNLLISKAYNMVGPEAAQILERQFEMFQPAQMKPVLQKFMTDNPSLFDADEYNRVDGVITDDVMKQKAINELSKRKDISAIQRARMTDAIINNKRNVVWPKSQE